MQSSTSPRTQPDAQGRRQAAFTARSLSIVFLTLLAPALGGTVKLWAQALICAGAGLLFLLAPPRRSLGRVPTFLFAALLVIALVAFLPAQWFPAPIWRIQLANLGAPLPGTISLQPWITLEGVALLFLQLTWAYYVLANDWSLEDRYQAWIIFALGIVLLSAALIFSSLTKQHIPFWGFAPDYGFFPNRNHTSNVLGLGGILVYALAFHAFGRRRKILFVAWLCGLSLIACALILNYSRGGIILLIGGVIAWHLYWLVTSPEKKRPLIASAIILLLLGLFAWNGGKTATRFVDSSGEFFSLSENTRLAIYRDALALSLHSPLTGVGLGNFSPVFTTVRHETIAPNIAGHPESDWVWMAVEMGWLAPILAIALFCWWLARCRPFDPGTFRLLRFAALVCVCAFVLHACFDVPGHQIGALWPAIFLAGTALHPQQRFAKSRATQIAFRIVGIALLIIASLWFALVNNAISFPAKLTATRLEARIQTLRDEGENAAAVAEASKLIRIAPLNWEAYQVRATSQLALGRKSEAKRDFEIARYLLPQWSDLWMKEGINWAVAGQIDEAFDTWAEMLRHFPKEAPDLYGQVYRLIKDNVDLVDRWRLLGRENKKCLLVFFQKAGPVEFRVELDRLLADEPDLKSFDSAEKRALFDAWYSNGDKLELAEALKNNTVWQAIGWRQLARAYADYGDFRNACEITRQFASIPAVPEPSPVRTPAELELQARLYPTQMDVSAALCLALAKEGRIDQALARLQALHELKGFPDYLRSLEANLWEQKGDWRKEWSALKPFVSG